METDVLRSLSEGMEHLAEWSVLAIEAMALVVILFGSVQAFAGAMVRVVSAPDEGNYRRIWLRYARWLVAGLTFQLAADVIETSAAPSLEEIGKLAAIAAIRTFLNYFLDRDMREMRAPPAGEARA